MRKRVSYRQWTLEEEAELRILWSDGLRGELLAAPFNRTVNAVQARAVLLGLTRSP